jgi:hypothetical protein
MNACAPALRNCIVAVTLAASLTQVHPAYAHGTDAHSSAGQHNYITADVYAQLDLPEDSDTFTGTSNVDFASAAGHKLVLHNTSMWGQSSTTFNYEFTLEYWGGPYGETQRILTTKASPGYPTQWTQINMAYNQTVTTSADLSDTHTFIGTYTYYAEAWVAFQFQYAYGTAAQHDHTFTVN